MCKEKSQLLKKKDKNENNDYYLRDYLGRSLSNCDRIEVDQQVNFKKFFIKKN